MRCDARIGTKTIGTSCVSRLSMVPMIAFDAARSGRVRRRRQESRVCLVGHFILGCRAVCFRSSSRLPCRVQLVVYVLPSFCLSLLLIFIFKFGKPAVQPSDTAEEMRCPFFSYFKQKGVSLT